MLVDVARSCAADGRPLAWDRRDVIDVALLRAAIDDSGATFVGGDILLLRTGWAAGYDALDDAGRAALGGTRPATPGLAATDDMAAFLWDLGLSAIAADNPALEASPTDTAGERLHPKLLARLGMPIGELWWLDELADACASDGRPDCLVTSAPLPRARWDRLPRQRPGDPVTTAAIRCRCSTAPRSGDARSNSSLVSGLDRRGGPSLAGEGGGRA